jgi:ketosteroid isomerase-like protein
METTQRPAGRPGEEILCALWLAHREGRMADLLALVDPDVEWHPVSRPGLTVYRGHAGTLAMLADFRSSIGDYWVDVHEYVALPDGRVVARGTTMLRTAEGEVVGPPFETVCTMRDGRIVLLESADGSDEAPG